MKQSTKRFASMMIALGFVIGAFIIFFNLVQPAYGTVGRLRGELASKKRFADEQAIVIDNVKKLIGVAEGGGSEREQIGLVFPEGPKVANAVSELNGLLVMNGLAPQSISVSVEQGPASAPGAAAASTALTAEPIRTVRFSVAAVGAYANLKRFLDAVSTNIRLMDTVGVTFAPVEKPSDDLYTFSIVVLAYYQ